MRVGLFVDTLNIGGAETMIVDLGRELGSQGIDVIVLHFGNTELAVRCARARVPSALVPGYRDFKAFVRLPRFAVKFARFLRQTRVSVLHSHLFGPIVAGALAAPLASVRHIGTLHDQLMIDDVPWRIHLLQAAALLGTRLVAVSEITTGVYRERAWFPRNDPTTIYNGIEWGDKPPAPKEQGTDVVRLISVGRLVSLKRYDRLIRLFAEVTRTARATLKIVGDGPERESLERLAKESGVAIEFAGHVTNVGQYLADADIFVLTSDTEALSRSVLEAMGAGLPCVVTDVGGIPEVIEPGVNGILIDSRDHVALVEAVDGCMTDPTLRRDLGTAARQTVLDRLGAARRAPSLAERLRSLVEARRRASEGAA